MKLIEFKSHKDYFDNEYEMSLIKTKRYSLLRITLVTSDVLSPFYMQLSIGQGSLSNLYCYVYKWGFDMTIFPVHYYYSDPEPEIIKGVTNEDIDSFEKQMKIAKKVMSEDIECLKALGD